MFHSLPLHRSGHETIAPKPASGPTPILSAQGFGISLGRKEILQEVSFDLHRGEVLGLIGRAGAGKTALLRAMCRLLDEGRGLRSKGSMSFGQEEIYSAACDLPALRSRIAFMPQEANPFPTSIWDNIAYGARLHRVAMDRGSMADLVEEVLRRCLLWEEVKDVLHRKRGTDLTIGQQRLLCLARSLAIRPEILLMDRPSGSVDRMELDVLNRLVKDLKQDHTLVVVTASLTETAQVADRVAYLEAGRVVEIDSAEMIFTAPLREETRAFLRSTAF